MKKVLFVFLLLVPVACFAHIDSVPVDSAGTTAPLSKQEPAAQSETDIITTGHQVKKEDKAACACLPKENNLGLWEWILVFLPILIFISVALILFTSGLKSFNFSEALKENELTTITIQNPLYQNSTDPTKVRDLPPTIQVTANVTIASTSPTAPGFEREYIINEQSASYRPSISRYIALISSLMIVIVAVALSSFFLYHYIRTSCPPQLESLSSVLIALGLGIVPYAANKVSSAISAPKAEA